MARVVNWEKKGAVALMTLDCPPVNQLGDEAMDAILECMDEILHDADVKVIVFTSAGTRVFCGGADIKSLPNYMRNYNGAARELADHGRQVYTAFSRSPKPVIAAMAGHTLGGGLEVALSCDMRVCAPDIKIGFPEVNIGMMPGGGGTQRLSRLIGYGRAIQLLLTGENIPADEAQRIGLVNIVAPSREETVETAMALANKIASFSMDSICLIKRAASTSALRNIEEDLDFETECFCQIYKSIGAKEGVDAFINKRKPNFEGI